jgi:hypothetical protein
LASINFPALLLYDLLELAVMLLQFVPLILDDGTWQASVRELVFWRLSLMLFLVTDQVDVTLLQPAR